VGRFIRFLAALTMGVAFLVWTAGAGAIPGSRQINSRAEALQQIGLGPLTTPENRVFFGVGLTECPHAGEPADKNPKPLDRRVLDTVEKLSNGGDDVRVNQDYSCRPQNETSIVVNPLNARNVVAGQNDYRLNWGTSGLDASTDNGNHWFDQNAPFPTAGTPLISPVVLGDDHLDGGGDPALTFDSQGVVYYASIHFEREREDNGIMVRRSTNGGFTWSVPCVVRTRNARCGGTGDPRKPGDGIVVFDEDVDGTGPLPAPAFNDKEYIASGPRPAGVEPVCFSAGIIERTTQPLGVQVEKTEVPCTPGTISPHRIYVTWTRFETAPITALIMLSYSDDQGRSWSAPREISGSAPFCLALSVPFRCDSNQFSSPTVNPHTGFLYVGFQNFNTEDENQYLVVRSEDGGETFEGPFFATFIFDTNYPDAGDERPDCTERGQQGGRNVLTNTCFRMFSSANMVVEKRNGAFNDDLYMVLSDNRNGTEQSTNTDVFLFKSTNGGETWIGPSRVNNDPSVEPANRECQVPDTDPETHLPPSGPCPEDVHTGNDNYYPWVDVSLKGDVDVGFYDRRLDTVSTLTEWPMSRSRTGNYLAWYWAAACSITATAEVGPALQGTKVSQLPATLAAAGQCLAPTAEVINPPESFLESPGPAQFGTTFLGPFRNATLSDVPQNDDYAFRAGIFSGDYSNLAIGPDGTAYAFWTDGRNGRGSGNDGSASSQPGRNPPCEQADVFMDSFSAQSPGTAKQPPSLDVINAFSVTPCPTDIQDRGNGSP
jgi:hypothetical protein